MCQVPKVARFKEYISKVKIQYINARGDSANIAETLLAYQFSVVRDQF